LLLTRYWPCNSFSAVLLGINITCAFCFREIFGLCMSTLRDAVNLHVATSFITLTHRKAKAMQRMFLYVTELEGCGGWNN